MGQDDVRRERGQFRSVSANFAGMGRGPVGVNPHVAANAPTQTLQFLQKRSDEGLKSCIIRGCGQEYADALHLLALLCAGGERPRGSRKKSDELAPPHSITSSARPISVLGTLMPSVFAALRFKNSSTLVAC